jgi:hypothetical protein
MKRLKGFFPPYELMLYNGFDQWSPGGHMTYKAINCNNIFYVNLSLLVH